VQKCVGYSISGDTRYETMFILFGATTRNGKGTSMETFLKICGDYGKTSRPETIGMKINSSSFAPSGDVARLAGARFVNISEPDKKLTLSVSMLKILTANDTINAKFLHENSFEFKPQFKLYINTNQFLQLVKKHSEISTSTPELIRTFVDKIIIYQAEKVNGQTEQRVKIYYNCIGAIEVD